MFIEEMTLKDFKSFGGAHKLPFGRGLTVIVGPNGSGKSNLLDGLRWALGENTPSRLRINRQSDLLFQGSPSKNEAKETSVTLHLAGDDSRVTLARRLDETGTAILVDGTKVRHLDLTDLKAAWGFGGDKFAFIGQGEITDQIGLKPYARRLALEELFGVDRYRSKREDAAKRLSEAEVELERLRSLASELQARREEIAPQMERARRAAEAEEQIARFSAELYCLRRYKLEEELKNLAHRAEEVHKKSLMAARWLKNWSALATGQEGESGQWARLRADASRTLEELRPQVEDLASTLSGLEAQWNRDGEALGGAREELERAARRRDESAARRDSEACETSRLSAEEKRRAAELVEAERKNELNTLTLQRHADQADHLRSAKSAAAEELLDLQSRLAGLSSAPETSSGPLENRRDSLMAQLADWERKQDRSEEELDALLEIQKADEEELLALGRRVNALRAAIAHREGELDATTASSAGGHPPAVTRLLAAARMGKLNMPLVSVSDAFNCPERYVTAVESALGGRLSWVLLDRVSDVQKAIELLKKTQAGRATLLPLERCKTPLRPVVADKDIEGWAADLVQAERRWSKAVDHLLGAVLVVKTYSAGVRLSKDARYPVVTLEGEVFQPGGSISGGAGKRMGPLQAKKAAAALQAAMDADREGLEHHNRRLGELNAAVRQRSLDIESARHHCDGLRDRVESKRRELRDVIGQLDELNRQARQRRERAEALQAQGLELEEKIERLTAQLSDLLGESAEDLAPQVAEARHAFELASDRAKTARTALLHWTRQAMEDQTAADRAEAALAALQVRYDDEKRELEQTRLLLRDRRSRLEEAKVQLNRAEEGWQRHNQGALRLARKVEGAKAKSVTLSAAIESLSEAHRRAADDLEQLVSSQADIPYDRGHLPEGSVETAAKALAKAERMLKNIGPFNRGALDEDASLAERLAFLGEQIDDAKAGIEQLNDVIVGADRQASTVFAGALKDIDIRFNSLFQRLFGGGEAHLEWDKSAGAWEGGVEITARPPGKRTLHLAQLSGGEQSLTALALLFAAMERAQVPLAVLDEVDAALDEVNLGRFADLATEYAKGVQLLCMTHRRQTMERADRAFGVTMNEPGLSKVVGLKVEEWI